MCTAIDKDKLVFLRRMDNQLALRNLVNIEYSDLYTSMQDDDSTYMMFTDVQLKDLIKNSGGPDVRSVFTRSLLIALLETLVKGLPLFTANAFQLDLQSRAIGAEDARRFRFVPGASIPEIVADDAPYPFLQYAGSVLGVPASAPRPTVQATPAGSDNSAAFHCGRYYSGAKPAAHASANTDDFVQPRPGTSTDTIFRFCASAWRDAGYPEDKKIMDDIRRKAVDLLVPGLNISTVRTQAARWYQHRQRFAL